MRQQCSFFKSNTAFLKGVFTFQNQRCICGSSATFSNPTQLLPQLYCFFKSNTAFAAAVLLFQIQRSFCRSSVGFSNSTMDLRRQRCFLKSSTTIRDSTRRVFSAPVSIPAVREQNCRDWAFLLLGGSWRRGLRFP